MLIDVTPIMTSNTSPEPYRVTCSSEYNSNTRVGYHCFNFEDEDYWLSKINQSKNSWIMIDFGQDKIISRVDIYNSIKNAESHTDRNCTAKIFNIEYSRDGEKFDIAREVINTDDSWPLHEVRSYTLNKNIVCRYLRLFIKEAYSKNDSGSDYVLVDKIKLYYDEDNGRSVTHKHFIQRTTLPMNSIDKILNKVNDSREGLLGMANNDENYGELYVVGKDGKSHLTRNGTKCEEIWSGIASSGNITLSKNLSEFKSVAFEVDSSGNRDKICTCMVSMTDNIIETGKFSVNEYSTRNIKFSFSKDNNDLNIVSYQLNVIGIIGFY